MRALGWIAGFLIGVALQLALAAGAIALFVWFIVFLLRSFGVIS